MFIQLIFIIQALFIYASLKIYLYAKDITPKELLLVILYLLDITFFFQKFESVGLILQILLLCLITYQMKRDWKQSLSSLSIVMICNILADRLTNAVLSAILGSHHIVATNSLLNADILEVNTPAATLLFLSLYCILTLAFVMIARRFFRANQELLTSPKVKNLFTLGITSIFVVFELNLSFEFVSDSSKNTFELNPLLLFVAIIFIASYTQLIRHRYEAAQQKLEYKVMKMYTSNLEQHYSDIRKFRHDYQNILTSLEGYITKKDYPGLESYFYENIKPTGSQIQANNFVLKDLAHMEIASVKSLLTSKVALAQEQHINVSIEITEPIKEIALSPISLIRILGIVLDNAMEGAAESAEKQLSIAFTKDKTATHIIIENTCPAGLPKLHVLKQEGFSTKGQNRGLGLTNLQELIDAAPNCTLLTKIENGHFNQTITIMNN